MEVIMIRRMKDGDINRVMDIWLESNIDAHHFIEESYWRDNYSLVCQAILESEVYVYEYEGEILGFAGVTKDYVSGIFVDSDFRSMEVGKRLINHVKNLHSQLELHVYAKNVKALRFYEREGFILEEFRIDKSTNEKECLMKWAK